MKRFFVGVLCVSVFFVGLASIVETAAAKFRSDDRALELIKKSREAIGGDAAIARVKSMTITGTTTHPISKNGKAEDKTGTMEINLELPNRYSKMMRIGKPGESDDGEVHKKVKVFVVKEGDGKKGVWKTDSGDDVKIDGDKVIIKKKGGTTKEVKIKGKHKIRVKKKGDGDAEVWVTEDGKEVKVDGDHVFVDKDGNKRKVRVIKRKGGKDSDKGPKENVFVIKKGDGDVEWKSDSDKDVKVEGDKIIITNKDGTTEEIKTDGKRKIRIRRSKDGKIVTEDIEKGDGENVMVFKSADGDKKHLKRMKTAGAGYRTNEMLRMTLALLGTAPEGTDASYKFAGQGNVDGNTTNIVEVTSKGSSFKLHLDASSNLPRMVSYTSKAHRVMFVSKDSKVKKVMEFEKDAKNAKPEVHQMRFSDFRSVQGLMLPHRWAKSVAGKEKSTTTISNFAINPSNISDKFKNQMVFEMKKKTK